MTGFRSTAPVDRAHSPKKETARGMVHVVNRDGKREPVSFDKVLSRVTALSHDLPAVDCVRVCQRTIQGIHDGVRTSELDDLAAETAAALAVFHPQYARLAGRITVSNLHKKTSADGMGPVIPLLGDDVAAFLHDHRAAIDAALVTERDMDYDYFGIKTLERSYLLRDPETRAIVERPQVLCMRVALGVHCGDLARVLETYDLLSRGHFIHATPTMFNAGTRHPTLASCFLLPIGEDSIDGIYDTLHRCALISKKAGGIGLSVTNVRAEGSVIRSTGGVSNGLLPMLRVFAETARYVDQGGGKRKGAIAAYLEPWHADVRTFLEMKKNHGVEERRARDLFYALWIPDLFMRRVEANEPWSLFCPSRCAQLIDLTGRCFDAEYTRCEAAGLAVASIPAQELWFAILDAQIETGTPYMLYKDACNQKSNHMHLGVIRSSNLCTEIVQYSSEEEIAVCNLASISLPKFVDSTSPDGLSFSDLAHVTRIVARNLNRVIDRNEYARDEARKSNLRHRPVGIGVQGLADVFAMLNIAFDSVEARDLNRAIFETIYFASLSESCALARSEGPYESYPGSPVSRGILQMDMWPRGHLISDRWDWKTLRADIRQHGLRNSLLVAPMPTASTAQILGNNECFEPFTSNVYVRRVLAGEFAVVNKHLVAKLESLGMWTDSVRESIFAANGSVQHLVQLPQNVRNVYKTAWELSMRTLIDLSADRAPFVDQSQSLNLFVASPTHAKLTSMHFYAWKKGLKTGMYYLRTRPAADAVKVTVPVEAVRQACQRAEPECESCSA